MAAVNRAEDDDDLAVVFRGRGNTFCSGADLDSSSATSSATRPVAAARPLSARGYDQIYNMKKPTVAVLEGYVTAGGFELMISCDFASPPTTPRSATSTSAARCSAAPARSTACPA